MPAPQKSAFQELAKNFFRARAIALPTEWKTPGAQYPDAFAASERVTAPSAPTTLFRDATLNKYHVDTATTIGGQFADYIDGICAATSDGIGNWLHLATVVGVVIAGPVGIVHPGCVLGPPLTPLILAGAPLATPQEVKYSNAIASAFGTLWLPWHTAISGMLMYPAFAAVPAPVAPPMPNVPLPLMALPSAAEAGLAPSSLSALMMANLADPTALHAEALFDAIAKAFGVVFQPFKASTLMQNVIGTGPVPTFAPPIVPVGPVLGGAATGAPGCLS
jgi:hypothetical protein